MVGYVTDSLVERCQIYRWFMHVVRPTRVVAVNTGGMSATGLCVRTDPWQSLLRGAIARGACRPLVTRRICGCSSSPTRLSRSAREQAPTWRAVVAHVHRSQEG